MNEVSAQETHALTLLPRRGLGGTIVAALFAMGIAMVLVINFSLLFSGQREIRDLSLENKRLAVIAAKTAFVAAKETYHNCVVTALLISWAKDLTPVEKQFKDDKAAHIARYKSFKRLQARLILVDGVPCVAPAIPPFVKNKG